MRNILLKRGYCGSSNLRDTSCTYLVDNDTFRSATSFFVRIDIIRWQHNFLQSNGEKSIVDMKKRKCTIILIDPFCARVAYSIDPLVIVSSLKCHKRVPKRVWDMYMHESEKF